MTTDTTDKHSGGDIDSWVASFRRHLEAENKAPRTIQTYLEAVTQLRIFLATRALPMDVATVTKEMIQDFIKLLLDLHAPATAHNRFRGLQQFFKFVADEGEIAVSPLYNMKGPAIPESEPRVLTPDEVRLMAKAAGGGLYGRRDEALIRFLYDTGVRRSEAAGLRFADIDLDLRLAVVTGKGRRERHITYQAKTARAIDRYLRERAKSAHADSEWLWISRRGRLTPSGIGQVLERVGIEAGLGRVNPHTFRHSFSHQFLANGGEETDLMRLNGWKSRAMVARYASTTGSERARASHKRFSPGEMV